MPHSLEARQQMLDECRSYYIGNPPQLSLIDEFERDYKHGFRLFSKVRGANIWQKV